MATFRSFYSCKLTWYGDAAVERWRPRRSDIIAAAAHWSRVQLSCTHSFSQIPQVWNERPSRRGDSQDPAGGCACGGLRPPEGSILRPSWQGRKLRRAGRANVGHINAAVAATGEEDAVAQKLQRAERICGGGVCQGGKSDKFLKSWNRPTALLLNKAR